jgi:hypothetical protein
MDDVPRPPQTQKLRCQECGCVWNDHDTSRWRAYVADESQELLLYCARCADREFGD